MTPVILPYNLAMLIVDGAAIWLLRRQKWLLTQLAILATAGFLAAAIGISLALRYEDLFGAARLCSFGVLLHGPLMLVGAAAVWRRERRWMAAAAMLSALGLVIAAADAFLIEPHWLDVTHYRIVSAKVRRPVRIVVVADFQADDIGSYERDVLERVVAEKPNLILFAGDYIQAPWPEYETLQAKLRELLIRLHAACDAPAFAVEGNIDYDDSDSWRAIFEGTGITAVSRRQSFELPDVDITCLSLWDSLTPSLMVSNPRPERFHIAVGHVPMFARGNVDADLLVAGHTHAGQVQVPGFGPVVVNCRIPRRWATGLNDLSGGRKLLVSRGTGMERGYAPPMRFFCRPELAVIDLAPPDKKEGDRQ
ncbi:MAG: metallophosphoesterase [Thermoguttaceae bacterium]